MPPEGRYAAILGVRFEDAALAEAFPEASRADLDRSGLVRPHAGETAFLQALIHGAIHDTPPANHYHASGTVLWAEHAMRAGGGEEAATACDAAAGHLLPQNRHAAAERFLWAGLALSAPPDLRASLLAGRGVLDRDRGRAEAAFDEALALARDPDLRVQIALRRTVQLKFLGSYEASADGLAAAEAIAQAEEVGLATRSKLAQELGDAALQHGDAGGCPRHDAVAHDAAARGGHVPQQVRAVGGLGDLLRLANARRAYENCLVAKAGGGAVGTAHAFQAEPTDPGLLSEADPVLAPSAALEAPGALHLSGPAVRERWRGRSLGSAVLAGAPSGVSLICSEKNGRARAFYERRGFHVVARRAVVPHPLLSVGGGALLMVRKALGGRGDRSRPRVGLGRTMPVPGTLRGGWRPLGPGWPGADARARRSAPPQRCGRPRTTREMS